MCADRIRIRARTDADAQRLASALTTLWDQEQEVAGEAATEAVTSLYRALERQRNSPGRGATIQVSPDEADLVLDALQAEATRYAEKDADVFGVEVDRLDDMANDLERCDPQGTRLAVHRIARERGDGC